MVAYLLRRWMARYFEVSGHYLTYYADGNKKAVKGAIDLSDLNAVQCVEDAEVTATQHHT